MDRKDINILQAELLAVLAKEDDSELRNHLKDIDVADVAEMFHFLEDMDRSRVMFALDSHAAAEVVVLLDEAVRGEIVEELPESRLAEMVEVLPPDDAADVVGDLPAEESDRLLEQLSDEQSEQIERLLEYDENTAGGLMNPDVPRVLQTATVREAIRYLRQSALQDDEVFNIYTINDGGQLTGMVSTPRLVVSPATQLLSEITNPDVRSVTVDEDQERVVRLFMKYDLTTLPVVDEQQTLVGHVTVDDVLDAAAEEADEDFYHMAGTDASELETTSVLRAFRIRFMWLIPPLFFMAGTATIMLVGKGTAQDDHVYGALLAFVPMIGALAGCCAVQTSTVVTRGLATGELAASNMKFAFGRESGIAFFMAPTCAVVAWMLTNAMIPVLKQYNEIDADVPAVKVANAVGLGMLCGVVVASILGMAMPFVFRRLGIDPAIAAGPMVTAANDVISVLVYISIASVVAT